MKYFVSSNLNYFKKTYPFIVKSLIESNISSKDIFMIVGSCNGVIEFDNIFDINIFFVDYNSFDFNALIYLSENFDTVDAEKIFLLHDTCLVGKNFKEYSNNYDENCLFKKLHKSISMNIGMYSLKMLQNNKSLQNFKMYPKDKDELQRSKEFCVMKEDYIFNQFKNKENNQSQYYSLYEESKFLKEEQLNFYFSDYYIDYLKKIKRRIQYIPSLDLYKFQANIGWQSKWIVEI